MGHRTEGQTPDSSTLITTTSSVVLVENLNRTGLILGNRSIIEIFAAFDTDAILFKGIWLQPGTLHYIEPPLLSEGPLFVIIETGTLSDALLWQEFQL